MNYIEFQKNVQVKIKEKLGDDYEVNIHKVMKNNDVELVSIMIQKKCDNGAVPTIYLEDYYEMYSTSISIDDVANSIIAVYEKHNGAVTIDIDEFSNFQYVKEKIMLKLINYERNELSLKSTPHKRVLDLAIVFYVLWEQEDGQRMSSTIRDGHLELWNVEMEELYEIAYENTIKKLSFNIKNIKELVYGMYQELKKRKDISVRIKEEIDNELNETSYPMYVISNKEGFLGAGAILYEQVLKYMYEKLEGKFYILPSSIHEVIVIPECRLSVLELKKMVTDINETEVEYMEILSDNVYCYDGDVLQIAN